MKILLLFAGLAIQAQELTITLKVGATEVSQTLTGAPVVAILEVLEAYRLSECAEYALAPVHTNPPVCVKYKYADRGETLAAVITGQIKLLSQRFPTSATATERATKAAADAALEAKRTLLFDVKPEPK